MLKRLRRYLSAFAVLTYARDSFAVDPYAVAKVGIGVAANAGTGGTAGIVLGVAGGLMGGGAGGLLGGGGGSGDVEDLSSIGFAFTELLDDFDIDKTSGEDLRDKVRELVDVNSKLNQGQVSGESLVSATRELKEANSLKEKLEAMHNMVERTKSIAQMIPGHPKASQSAMQVQQTRLDYMTLDEISKLRQLEFEKKIDRQITESRYRLLTKSIRDEEKKARKL